MRDWLDEVISDDLIAVYEGLFFTEDAVAVAARTAPHAPDATNAALLAFLRSLRTVAAELPNEVWAQISPQKSARVY
jgi:hypothetical protein